MTFLPIVERELRVASRRRGLYWIRFAAGFIAAGLCAWIILVSNQRDAGQDSFDWLATFTFFYTAIAGISAACDSLSEEKREGTLGLLFLTDLRGADVVLGKLAACSVSTLYGLLAGIPVLAIPLLLGGVGYAEFCRVALAALTLLFFFLTLGIFTSSICRQEQRSLSLAIFLGLALAVGLPFLISIKFHNVSGTPRLLITSPLTMCATGFDGVYRTKPNAEFYWESFVATCFYAFAFLGLACFWTPRSWQEQKIASARPAAVSAERKDAWRRAILEINPFFWRSARPRSKRARVWIALGGCLAVWSWIMIATKSHMFVDSGTNTVLLVMFDVVLKYWIALESSQAFANDRRSGGFELLLCTPLKEEEIVDGQNRALLWQFGPPLGVVLLAHGFLLSISLRSEFGSDNRKDLVAMYVIMAVFLALDAVAISRWSMWLGLKGRKPIRAAMQSLAWMVAAPPAIFLMFLELHTLMAPGVPPRTFVIFWWCALGLAPDLYFTIKAQSNFARLFRQTASSQPALPAAPAPAA